MMPTDIQTYALRRVVMVQRREIMELREELARAWGIIDQLPLLDTLRAEEQWHALCAVADHEGAGMVEEFVHSGAPLPDTFTLRGHDGVIFPEEDGDA